MKRLITTMAVVLVAATAVRADTLATWDNNSLAAQSTSAPVGATHANITSSDLTFGSGFTTGNASACLAVKSIFQPSLAAAITTDSYFSTTLSVDAGYQADFDNVGFEGTAYAWNGAATVDVALLSSESGFTASDVLGTISGIVGGNPGHFFDKIFDVSGISELDAVTGNVEFRLYVYNTGANNMSQFTMGHAFYTGANPGTQDLEFNGTVSAIPEPATLELLVFVSGGMLWIRRKFAI